MKQEIVFGIYDTTSKDAKAIIVNGKVQSIRLIFSAPRGQYYSFLNDASIAFNEQYPQYATDRSNLRNA